MRQLVLEYPTERAGDVIRFGDKQLSLGVVNPRTENIETSVEIEKSIDRALRLYSPEKLFLIQTADSGPFPTGR